VLTFSSAVTSPWVENNRVHARLFAAANSGPAVVVLPQWNAKWDVQVKICRWLNRCGITALRLSMPYHDRRMIPGHERADYLVGPDIGLTLQANRQAVADVRRALQWLASQGYGKLGLVGTSIGSAVGFITLAHEPLVRAGVFLHVSTYFADVVRTGMNTAHVWESLRANVTGDELRRFWSPISPFPYVPRMRGSTQKMLMVSARYDPTFWPQFSNDIIREVRQTGMESEVLRLPCGHYSLELAPFSYAAALRMGSFLFRTLA
jgi:pimeloyl-ACP methyl ester carboxylesterase